MSPQPSIFEDGSLSGLIPLNMLPPARLQALAGKAREVRLNAGDILFERGDQTPRTYYLLTGEVSLSSPVYPAETVQAGSETARYPLAHHLPRHVTACARNEVRLLCIEQDILELLHRPDGAPQTKDETWKSRWLRSPLFERLAQDNIEAMLERMQEMRVPAGQVILHQDEAAEHYYVIKTGRCSVSRRPAPRAHDVKLAELVAGQGFGEEALITNATRNASVNMLEDGTLMRLTKEDFIQFLAQPLLKHVNFGEALQMSEKDAVLIDVRTPEEFETNGLIGSLCMPMPVLRLKASRLDRQRSYIVYSNTGQFSSAAAFLLLQQGVRAYVLKGGLDAAPSHRMKKSATRAESPQPASGDVVTLYDKPARNQVDYHNLSDDALWRSTIGIREDAGIEALWSGGVAPSNPHATDTSNQGFGDMSLFTRIDTPASQLALSDDEQRSNATIATDDHHHDNAPARSEALQPRAHAGNNKDHIENSVATRRPRRRKSPWMLIFTALAVSALSAGYYHSDEVRSRIHALTASGEEMQDLNDKVDRMIKFLEHLPSNALPSSRPTTIAPTATETAAEHTTEPGARAPEQSP